MKKKSPKVSSRSRSRLLDFFASTATDPDRLTHYIRDPEECAEACGLNNDEIDVLTSGESWRIYHSLQNGSGKSTAIAAPAGRTQPFAEDLVVLGTGIRTVGHLTLEAIAWLRRADHVLYLVSDPIAEAVIKKFHGRKAEPLQGYYSEKHRRIDSYLLMVEAVMKHVRRGRMTVFAVYGHPGVFAFPPHEAVRRARAEGYRARMLPGVSAEDCLFADLGVDPATSGCQSYEATDFLIHRRSVDPTSHLILWQIGVLGNLSYSASGQYATCGMPLLLSRLMTMYPPMHPVVVYEAPVFAGVAPTPNQVPLCYLAQAPLSTISTLYVPPAQPSRDDYEALQALGLV